MPRCKRTVLTQMHQKPDRCKRTVPMHLCQNSSEPMHGSAPSYNRQCGRQQQQQALHLGCQLIQGGVRSTLQLDRQPLQLARHLDTVHRMA
jgi:hypothetical protein